MSHCHGWSAGPAYYFPSYILGVQVKEPGFKQISIEPRSCGLDWAKGVIPAPQGDIKINWQWKPVVKGLVDLPEGVEAEVIYIDNNGNEKIKKLQSGKNVVK